jgi:cytochrome c-type biogenesis protein CcmH/NrfG
MIGNCQYAKGDLPGALGSYRRSLELHPDNPQLRAFVESQNR